MRRFMCSVMSLAMHTLLQHGGNGALTVVFLLVFCQYSCFIDGKKTALAQSAASMSSDDAVNNT